MTAHPAPVSGIHRWLVSRRPGIPKRLEWLIGIVLLAPGCGAPLNDDDVDNTTVGDAAETVSVSGRITFDYVPLVARDNIGLDYNATESRPVRGATVQLVSGDRVVATTFTDADGGYEAEMPADTEVFVRIRAELGAESNRIARVLDNVSDDAVYALDGTPFSAGDADLVRHLHAGSGWTGTGYSEPRAAAPFAILDVAHEAVQWIRSVDADVELVPLDIYWSLDNLGISGHDGQPDYQAGHIGGSHYRPQDPGRERPPAIYLLGAENEDTDEYDRFVVAHEWMHYLVDTLARDDSIGGRHALDEQLDPRVAFSEGLANALAAAMLGDSEFAYSLGPEQRYGASFSVEDAAPRYPGWFSEYSVSAIAYDLLDPIDDDGLELGFGQVYDALVNDVRETPAVTSLFAFIHALKQRRPELADAIDALLGAHRVDPVIDVYGTGETHSGYPANVDVLPVHSGLTVNGGPVIVCSTSDFRAPGTGGNSLGIWRFVGFTAADDRSHTLSITSTSAPPGVRPDPSWALYGTGLVGEFHAQPADACGPDYLAACSERFSGPLQGGRGEYVVAVAEATNASRDETVPPAGRVCFEVEVSRP